MFLSVQTGQPGLDFCEMLIPDTKIELEACKTLPIIRQNPGPVRLTTMTRTELLRGHILESKFDCFRPNISVNAEERLRVLGSSLQFNVSSLDCLQLPWTL